MKMKLITLIGAFALMFVGLHAQQQNSLLWQISGNGLEQPSYLFGTIHTICPDELELSPAVVKALDASRQLVLEVDMDDPTFLHEMQRLSVNPQMQNLSGALAPPDLEILNGFLQKHYQADMSQLGILRPFALLSMMFLKGLDCPDAGSYEAVLMEYGAKAGWEILGLEEVSDQVRIFDRVPVSEQLKWLVKYAGNEAAFREDIARLTEAYKSENLDRILDLMTGYLEYARIEDALLYERNEKWIDQMIELATGKPTFFAVGAAHLPSERGVIQLLRDRGFVLTPISGKDVKDVF